MSDDRDYEVGDCRPPVQTRFQKGQSGNPKGRPKGSKNLKTDLLELLAEKVAVTENGRARKIPKQRLMLMTLIAKAIKGDTKATGIVLQLMAQTVGLAAENRLAQPLAADDAEILAAFSDWVSKTAPGGVAGGADGPS